MRVGSLFSGCLGLDLGLEQAGFETAWVCENDLKCQEIIRARRPGLTIHDDVRDLKDVEPVDVLAGGFPCQDLSYAGRGKGLDGERSGLWFNYADAIRALRPRLVLVENVPGLATRGLGRVLYDLAEAGYVGSWIRLRASDVGAPHRRERLFILAANTDGVRVDADGRFHRRGAGEHGGSVQAHVSAGTEIPHAADSVADGAGASADAGVERFDGGGGSDEGREAGGRQDGRPVVAGSSASSSDPNDIGWSGGNPEPSRETGTRTVLERSQISIADADGSGWGEHGGAVAVRPEHAAAERGGDDASADADGESGQSGVGRRVEGGVDSRARAEERNGDRHDGPAERGTSVQALADADEPGVEAWGDEGSDGERSWLQSVGSAALARGRAATSDSAGGGWSGGEDGTWGDEESWEEAVGGEGDVAVADGDRIVWGTYEPAVRQWERLFGRPAPRPTDDRGRLSPEFVEWMMGFPEGWTDGVPRTARLRMLGNAVQVQCGTVAGLMLREMAR